MAKPIRVPFELDMLMACRYTYYCKAVSLIPDQDYDQREAEWELEHGPLPVGSAKPESYTPAQRALALYFMLSGRVVSRRDSLL